MSDMRELRRAVLKDGVLWLTLLALVAASVVATETVHTYAFPIELAVAALQVALIGTFFMQLRGARPLILLTAASATVFLLSMFVLSLNDLFTRI